MTWLQNWFMINMIISFFLAVSSIVYNEKDVCICICICICMQILQSSGASLRVDHVSDGKVDAEALMVAQHNLGSPCLHQI